MLKYIKSGTTVENVNFDEFQKVLIPIAPVQQIDKITSATNNATRLISAVEDDRIALVSYLAKVKSKILDLAIRGRLVPQDLDDEPASVLLERIRAEKEELIKQGRIKRDKKESFIFRGDDNSYYEKFYDGTVKCIDVEIPFEVPKMWAWARLSSIVCILNGDRGQNYPAKSKLHSEGIPFVNASNIENGVVSSNNLYCLSESQYNALGAGKLIAGDIVYCIRGSLGKCGMFFMEKGAIASSLVIVRSIHNKTCITDYIFIYLNSTFADNEIKKYDNGSAQPNLAAKDFNHFLEPIPPLKEQTHMLTQIHSAFGELDKIEKTSTEAFFYRRENVCQCYYMLYNACLIIQWRHWQNQIQNIFS